MIENRLIIVYFLKKIRHDLLLFRTTLSSKDCSVKERRTGDAVKCKTCVPSIVSGAAHSPRPACCVYTNAPLLLSLLFRSPPNWQLSSAHEAIRQWSGQMCCRERKACL